MFLHISVTWGDPDTDMIEIADQLTAQASQMLQPSQEVDPNRFSPSLPPTYSNSESSVDPRLNQSPKLVTPMRPIYHTPESPDAEIWEQDED